MAKKIINSDIYNMRKLIDDVKKELIPEETESTLAMSQMGYIGDIEAKRLQTQVIMSGELCNESFPSRARLERNVITHAIINNIEKINATPSKMDAILGIRQEDIDSLMIDDIFVIDRECPIYVEEFEYHLDYDIIIKRVTISGNEKVYTAQYDIQRDNPSSNIVNPYISSPAVILIDHSTYIFINIILSQVYHGVEYTKPTTSNIIDNKTVNFIFEDQLAYFEIHVTESDEDYYLTPVFEGSGVPDSVVYYCWYQYIDTDMIRIRFDRNSYMPGLNSEIEILYKTTRGADGNNDKYKDDIYINLESSKYGYKNLSLLFKAVSNSEGGKNRKSKKELQAMIPKEALARGSLTTAKDLNNYFGMIDTNEGRIVVQKKIDNQQERIYYAYFVLKDVNADIVPSNTIDLKIPMDQLIKTSITDSASPRYILRSGACIHLTDDNQTGEIVSTPIKNLGLTWTMPPDYENKIVNVSFSIRVDSDEYPSINCRAISNSISSAYIESPLYGGSIYAPSNNKPAIDVVNTDAVSCGQRINLSLEYTCKENGSIVFTDTLNEAFTYIPDTAVYFTSDDRVPTKVDPVITDNIYVFTIPNAIKDKTYHVTFEAMVNEKISYVMNHSALVVNGSFTGSTGGLFLYGIILTIENNPPTLLNGNILKYNIQYQSTNQLSGNIIGVELSRGVSYVTGSGTVKLSDKLEEDGISYNYNPSTKDLTQDAGFLYTNPYSIVINHHHLYSAFYMMCVNISPYVHFEYINQRSSIQFITTNVNWERPFLGYNRNIYTMGMEVSQSVAKDMGLIVKDDAGEITDVNVKLIAIFYRDGSAYRYKNLEFNYAEEDTYTYNFKATFEALDLLDQDNNIKVNNMGLLKQYEEEYGFFNANTEVKIYALCKVPDVDGRYTRYNIDTYVPGLDGWTVTNVYDVVNGVDFYYNYAEIMGSRVSPYGITKHDKEADIDILEPEGYYVKGVPVFGYDYCRTDMLINNAVNSLNDKKLYIDDAAEKCENSFGIDFKLFNTYGPSKIFYILKDMIGSGTIDGYKTFIDKVNLTMNFRLQLKSANDTYTKNLIVKEIKDYMEDLNEMSEIHIPKLTTQINTNYNESIIYFEFLGFNDYGPGIQHLYKMEDSEIPIHDCPEFININNVQLNGFNNPDINIYLSSD